MEAEKPQDLQSSSWRSGDSGGVNLSESQSAHTPRRDNASVQVGKQEKTMSLSKAVKQGKFSLVHGRSTLLFYSGLQLVG